MDGNTHTHTNGKMQRVFLDLDTHTRLQGDSQRIRVLGIFLFPFPPFGLPSLRPLTRACVSNLFVSASGLCMWSCMLCPLISFDVPMRMREPHALP